MKRLQYTAILMMLLVASCTTDEFIHNEDIHPQGGDKIQLVARNASFTEYEVASRATDDNQLTYDFVIFGSDGEGTCVYYNHCEEDIINIDRVSDFSGIDQDLLSSCDMYVLVNYPGIYNKILADATSAGAADVVEYIKAEIVGKKKLEYFNHIPTPVVRTVNMDESALPRIGRYSERVDLRTSADIVSGTIYPIDLQSLYAKMEFRIDVDPIEEDPSLGIPNLNTFQIEGYAVHNLAKEVDLWSGTEGSTHDDTEVYTEAVEGVLGDDVPRTPVRELSFTCYLPERFFRPGDGLSADNFEYPFGTGNNIREEDKVRRQRYKPLLAKGYEGYDSEYDAAKDKKATYLTLSGVFTNHQGHTFDVTYDIYVGNDNFGNFDVVRNRHYINYITIRGIQNSSDQSADAGAVSIDHRVNVQRTLPVILSLRREMLLDAHYEVRPLRIKKKTPHDGTESHVKVEVIYYDDDGNEMTYTDGKGNWIGLERSFGDGEVPVNPSTLYCVGSSSSAGKRKYFTYDLVDKSLSKGSNTDTENPLHTSTSIIVPIPDEGETECVWIYVDECTEASSTIDAKRSATIRVTCGTVDNGSFNPVGDAIDYVIKQHNLFKIETNGRTYYIEHEEEYLHNYDSEDTYDDNQTEYEGMVWGLYNAQLSFTHNALYVDGGIIGGITPLINNAIQNAGVKPFYDFYIPVDKEEGGIHEDLVDQDHGGWIFCDEIIGSINTNSSGTGYNGTIGAIAMNELPTSAIEYVYNRNKRNRDGTIASFDWYLPAIDEMQEIMVGAGKYFDDFIGQFYWSCQPSYLPNYAYHSYLLFVERKGVYYVDDTGLYDDSDNAKGVHHNRGYARATKAIYIGDDGDDSTPEWDYAASGTTGFDNAVEFSGAGVDLKGFHYTGTFKGNTLENWNTSQEESIVRQEGNFERNTKHRVRCVRKHNGTKTVRD